MPVWLSLVVNRSVLSRDDRGMTDRKTKNLDEKLAWTRCWPRGVGRKVTACREAGQDDREAGKSWQRSRQRSWQLEKLAEKLREKLVEELVEKIVESQESRVASQRHSNALQPPPSPPTRGT